MTPDQLPPLPETAHRGPTGTGDYFNAYTADQMHAYATAATAALRAEMDALRRDAERYRWLRDNGGDWAICQWLDDDREGIGYYREGRAAHVVDAAIDAAMKEPT
jgi:hypothetical protein